MGGKSKFFGFGIVLCFILILPVWAAEGDINRLVSAQLLTTINTPYLTGSFRESFDSRHIAFIIQKGVQKAVVTDGKAGQAFDDIYINSLQFTPDSQDVVYIAKTANKYTIVRNGKTGKLFNNIAEGSLLLSPDGQKLVYAAQIGEKWCVMVNDKAEAQYEAIGASGIRLSSDGLNLAYPARLDGQWMVVRNGVRGKGYSAIVEKSLIFSPNGKKLAYIVKIADKWSVVVDDVEGKSYENLGINLCFSPDGSHISYAAKRDGFWRLVTDAKEGPPYDEIASGSIAYSPDGKHLAYAALAFKKWVVVADRRQGPEVDGIGDRSPQYSPDSRQLFYTAKYDTGWAMVSDGEPGILVDGVGKNSLVFSPDGKISAFCAKIGGKWSVLIQGIPGERYDSILTGHGGQIVFDGPDLIHYLAMKGNEVYLVKEKLKIEGATTFKPDSNDNGSDTATTALMFNPPPGTSGIKKSRNTRTTVLDGRTLVNEVLDRKIKVEFSKNAYGVTMTNQVLEIKLTRNGLEVNDAAVSNLRNKSVDYEFTPDGGMASSTGDISSGGFIDDVKMLWEVRIGSIVGYKVKKGDVVEVTLPYQTPAGVINFKISQTFLGSVSIGGKKYIRVKYSLYTNSPALTDYFGPRFSEELRKSGKSKGLDATMSGVEFSSAGEELLDPETMLIKEDTAVLALKAIISVKGQGNYNCSIELKTEDVYEY